MYCIKLFLGEMFRIIIHFILKIITRFFQQALVVDGRSVGVIFANMDAIDKYREELATVTLVGIDGTFKTVPRVPADLKCFLTIQVVFKSVVSVE